MSVLRSPSASVLPADPSLGIRHQGVGYWRSPSDRLGLVAIHLGPHRGHQQHAHAERGQGTNKPFLYNPWGLGYTHGSALVSLARRVISLLRRSMGARVERLRGALADAAYASWDIAPGQWAEQGRRGAKRLPARRYASRLRQVSSWGLNRRSSTAMEPCSSEHGNARRGPLTLRGCGRFNEPRPSERGNHPPHHFIVVQAIVASMEPRPSERGNRRGGNSTAAARPSFNGATSFERGNFPPGGCRLLGQRDASLEPRPSQGNGTQPPAGRRRAPRFNGATSFERGNYPFPTFDRASPPASMEPRC